MRILIADDEPAIRKGIRLCLTTEGHDIIETSDGKEALTALLADSFDLVISDVKMPEMTGLELHAAMLEHGMTTPIMMMTAFANVEDAVRALKSGAEDYLTKPLNLDELLAKVKKIHERLLVKHENENLKNELRQLQFPDMVGTSRAIRDVQHRIQRVAQDGDVPVMISGKSGTGKELAARMIHNVGPRQQEKFVAINCAAFHEELLDSELFGHKKGAFTGAISDKAGIFQTADRGTLFLDEVSEMSPRMQAKLLRTLQEGTIQPVGSEKSKKVNVRIIGASNINLADAVKEQGFREDLYYRLNVVEIHMPKLCDRRDDIPLLFQHFVERYGGGKLEISPEVHQFFQTYNWPGNVRELENVVRMLLATHSSPITLDNLPNSMASAQFSSHTPASFGEDYKTELDGALADFECAFFSFHLQKNGGNISQTAQRVGLSRVALHQKIKKHGIRL
jgi:DNA-binding NtrC family response regulator